MTVRAEVGRGVAVLAIACVLLTAAAGCGEETWGKSPAAKEQALGAVETWLGACAEQDGEAAVEVLPAQTHELIFTAPNVLAGCERIARLGLPPDADPKQLKELFETATVEHVEVEAGFGTALLRSAKGTPSELQLEFDQGRWMISNPPLGVFEPPPPPPPPPPPAPPSPPPPPPAQSFLPPSGAA